MKEKAATSSFDSSKMPLQAITMIVLKTKNVNTKNKEISKNSIFNEINGYRAMNNHGSLVCPHCKSSNFIRWGTYDRNVIYIKDDQLVEEVLTIQRYRCKDCGKTNAVLAAGLVPYKQFTIDVLIDVLINPNSKNINSITNLISIETIKRWQKQFKKHLPYLITMFKTKDKETMFNKIKNNILKFYEDYYKFTNSIFMQIKFLYFNMCPL